MKLVTEHRIDADDYEFATAAHKYSAQRVVSEYGDKQWVVDRDDKSGWIQVDTLADVRRNIAADARTP